MKHFVSLFIPLMFATGCTTSLATSSDRITEDRALATTGVPYSLPMLQYDLKISRTLAQCKAVDADGELTELDHVRFSVVVEATARYIPGETYLIDYRELAGPSKITAFSLTNHENTGTLQSLNVSAEDRTAQIVGNVTKSAVGIAALLNGIPVPGAEGQAGLVEPPDKMLVCSTSAQALLTTITERTQALKTVTGQLNAANARIKAITEQSQPLSEDQRNELNGPSGLLTRQKRLTLSVARAQRSLSEAQTRAGSVLSFSWPERPNQTSSQILPDPAGFSRLANLLELKDYVEGTNGTENGCPVADVRECLMSKLGVSVELEPTFIGNASTIALGDNANSAIANSQVWNPQTAPAGIFVRPPVSGRLVACHLSDANPGSWIDQLDRGCTKDDRTLLLTEATSIPQLGQLRFFPFENAAFENNALSLSLRTDGAIEKFEYKETGASAETATGALASTVTEIGALATALRADRDAEADAALAELQSARDEELAVIQFEIDRITKQRELDQLNTPAEISELASIQAETAQTDARTERLEAIIREREAERRLAELP